MWHFSDCRGGLTMSLPDFLHLTQFAHVASQTHRETMAHNLTAAASQIIDAKSAVLLAVDDGAVAVAERMVES